ncbi:heat shock protein DNAJ, putative [Trypanosoma brucei gambiense DAL972]|uniref:Heat shock protein DNAJ, putative n=1 Tax=Trypanosoma brucei gambiense (strain MHOM/CI/86/DAL972) TaxID=679716 RepID=C9ZSC3_TRYB9|nr:heat shock protein DNAJ, putative [Trypanosoma brucei gambiense DAL972]CBH12261.1 heat shock protein DNAJ, putative [Trypanosoma brucei gambiense DAL972]|eukprot:XP_011774542.1 heat shock protein DNAJ, putative [Trypanosoma brucei gambiense DAL972]
MFAFSDHMDDVFNAFFSGGDMFSGGGGRGRRRQPKDAVHGLPVTLKDLYNGRSIEIPHTRTTPCVGCDGRGAKSRKNVTCTACRGAGRRMLARQMGMMIQQVTVPCDACGGEGRRMDPRDICPVCDGRRVNQVESSLTVVVKPGMEHREQIVFHGEGSYQPAADAAGDIVIVLEQMKDDRFEREGDDLLYTHTISLAESLCGFQLVLTHLDGRQLVVRRERGEITRPGERKVVLGEGMPIRGRKGKFGDLVIKFAVSFPERIEEAQVEILRQALPAPRSVDLSHCDMAQECYVSRKELDHLRQELENDVEEQETTSVGCTAQ